MKDIGYTSIALVVETWDQARFQTKNFENEFGIKAVQKMFQLEPRTKSVFGYDKSEEEGRAHMEIHAKAFPGLIDSVIQMLGPDVEFIQEILSQVGERHRAMKVNPSFFPFMGKALLSTLEDAMGRQLNTDERAAWEEVYEEISAIIVKEILKD
mmetsp:Transcript_14859/g.41046  ORF Transcript_14859/g.41046 Transcript_14859/m.41046 type:complete len:154 (+) Transcript_14859:54-515(+)|eukprot:CAMPEP_0168765910 /NCGR_PEP_ID=MMETSP0725-20121227/567_1 /TAXON_ID=265536 /ORGANISM="Amphiprora sp., Strain CCMP467" /LENGTH=153 /DNA_ID=CAMNT_0008815177 /DNA_START=78 /DNA_END=539 /DNA_ORIENTATION=-